MNRKIVITGSEGLIGQHLKSHLKQYEIIPLDIALGHDLTDTKFVEDFFKQNKQIYSTIILHAYNPLPLKDSKKIEPVDFSISEIKEYMDVNVLSAFDVCRNYIKNNEQGRIINVSSLYGEVSPKHHIYNNFTKHIGYSLSKGSIIMLTKYLATYYPRFNINTVILGGIYQKEFDESFVRKYSRHTPKKRMMGLSEMIPCFEFLLNEKSTYVTGTEIKVDGGWTAW
tara:strand:- start:437 stop:1114 length:678 start_codon:yes stop_codon:yes gene_type:complete